MANLLEPLTVHGITLRNRIVYPPMQTGRASFQGEVTQKLIGFYVRRSAHLGLPIVEHSYVSPSGKIGPKQLAIHNDSLIDGLQKLATAIHEVGAPAIIQISHAGGVALKQVINQTPKGPSNTKRARQLEVSELYGLAEDFVSAAERAVKAGFDGVEIHGAHAYLLCQFFSPLMNKRTDEFGGCVENRMRFPLLVVQKVRAKLGEKLLLYRMPSDDLCPAGIQIHEAQLFAQNLEAAGVDILDVSGGMCGSNPRQLQKVKGYFVPQASEVKKTVKAPVVGVGGITSAKYANSLVCDGLVDLVAVGRAIWKDPQWCQKAFETLKTQQ